MDRYVLSKEEPVQSFAGKGCRTAGGGGPAHMRGIENCKMASATAFLQPAFRFFFFCLIFFVFLLFVLFFLFVFCVFVVCFFCEGKGRQYSAGKDAASGRPSGTGASPCSAAAAAGGGVRLLPRFFVLLFLFVFVLFPFFVCFFVCVLFLFCFPCVRQHTAAADEEARRPRRAGCRPG